MNKSISQSDLWKLLKGNNVNPKVGVCGKSIASTLLWPKNTKTELQQPEGLGSDKTDDLSRNNQNHDAFRYTED